MLPGHRLPRQGTSADRRRSPYCGRCHFCRSRDAGTYSATVMIASEVRVDRLWHAVPAFPAISEVWLRILETYRDRVGTAT